MPTGFDVIIDVVSGGYFTKNMSIAALDAHIVTLSMLGGRYTESLDIAKLLSKRITLSASTLRNRNNAYKARLVADFTLEFYQQLSDGDIKPVIDSIYSWQEAEIAHDKLASNNTVGKLILTLD
jgi:NADPH:quinone reductase-like Zn-dependent oxidoreductase